MLGTIWVICASSRYSSEPTRRNCLLALVVGMYFCSTMHSSLQWLLYSNAINDTEGQDGVALLNSLTHIKPWIEATGDAFFCLNIFIADCLFIWRCWVVWQRRWIIVILPICATATGAVLAGLIINDQVVALDSDVPYTVVQKTKQFVTLSSAYFALSISTSLTTTLLITLRVLLVQRASRKFGVKRNPYSAVIEILVESAVLYSATLLIFVVLNSRKDTNFYFAQNIHAQVAGLAPMLIVLRVAAGHSRKDDEWSMSGARSNTASIQFAPTSSTRTAASTAPELDAEVGQKESDMTHT
ncbi:hypothetical protein OF83DRAFT_659555 [Amylostereum chailletii]|nr:hypothetical protein OF83DRAFT_659555 [Amylostereum chailletii]